MNKHFQEVRQRLVTLVRRRHFRSQYGLVAGLWQGNAQPPTSSGSTDRDGWEVDARNENKALTAFDSQTLRTSIIAFASTRYSNTIASRDMSSVQ